MIQSGTLLDQLQLVTYISAADITQKQLQGDVYSYKIAKLNLTGLICVRIDDRVFQVGW